MRRLKGVLIVILFACAFVKVTFAQPVRGKKFEFSVSASMYNVKDKNREIENMINIPLRIGYFIFRGLEIESELLLTKPKYEDWGYLVLANFVYNFKNSTTPIPFILAGGGYGNGAPAYASVSDQDMGVTALDFGAGIKYLVGDSAAIRIEYRCTKYLGEKTVTSHVPWPPYVDTYTYKIDRTDNNVFVGLSIFF